MAGYLNRWASANCNSAVLQILEPRNGSYTGTADAVYQNIDFLKQHASDLVLVLAGDHIYKMDYQKMIAYHRQTGADATVAVIPVPIEEAHRFGIVNVDGQIRITDFVEKPEVPQSNLVSMGIYIFNKQVLINRLNEDAALPDSLHDFGHAIMPNMIRQDNVAAYKFSGYWRDIGTLQAYYESNMDQLLKAPFAGLDGIWPVLSEPNGSSPPRVFQHGNVKNSYISPDCVIDGRVENSLLSPGVRVEKDAVVRNSVIMANTFVGDHSVVNHCILGESVDVGRFCYLGFGGAVMSGERGITVLGDGVTVPPHTAIGQNCQIMPHSGPSDFTRKVVPSNNKVPAKPSTLSSRTDNEREEVLSYGNKSLSTP
jgi:glucose-1-phosphate adenylyltransferase